MDAASGIYVGQIPGIQSRPVGMSGDKRQTVIFCIETQLLLGFILAFIIFGGAGGVQYPEMF